MTFTAVTADQRSDEWFAARCGRLTSSVVDLIFKHGKKKDDESTQKRDLRIRLALEQVTGKSQDGNDARTADMQRGCDMELDARLAYEAHAGVLLREVGFLSVDDLLIGASPDAIVGDYEGGVELKCPKTFTHLEYIRGGVIPADYLHQMRMHLLVTGAPWWDFVSFDDRMPEGARLFVRRLHAADADLPAFELAVRNFLNEVEAEKAAILKLVAA